MREAFQRAPVKVCIRTGNTSGGGGGDVDDEDPDPDEDSPPSGPDAGGGEVDEVLPASEWEVEASSANYTLSQVDQDRCAAGEEGAGWVDLSVCVLACSVGPKFSWSVPLCVGEDTAVAIIGVLLLSTRRSLMLS